MAVLRLAPQEVDTDGEVMTEVAARRLTDKIRRAGESIDTLLLEAYEGRAHLALGYDTWEKYVKAEFELSTSEGYRKLDKATVTRELTASTGVTRARDLPVSGRQAAVLKKDLATVTTEIAADMAAGVEPAEAVRAAVARRQNGNGKRGVIPAASRETTTLSDEQIMAMAAALRPRLRAYVESVKAILRFAPKPGSEAQTTEELLDEIHDWVAITGQIIGKPAREPVYELQGEMYRLALAINPRGGERETLSKLAGCSEANIDYHRNG